MKKRVSWQTVVKAALQIQKNKTYEKITKSYSSLWTSVPSIFLAYGNPPNSTEILTQTRQSYYNLKKEGMVQFQCDININWESLIKNTLENPIERQAALHKLNASHFSFTVNSEGKINVTNNLPKGFQVQSTYQDLAFGTEMVIRDFFDIWSSFMINPPFAQEGGEFHLEKKGNEYLLSYPKNKDQASIDFILSDNFIIKSKKIKRYIEFVKADLEVSIFPKFQKATKGFILSEYSTNLMMSGQKAKNFEQTGADTSQTIISNQEIKGLQIPRKVFMKRFRENKTSSLEFTFDHCQVSLK